LRKNLLEVLKALLEDCKRSDRDIAKAIGISQPTVTRSRQYLNKKGYVQGYTAIPDLSMIGLEIIAFNVMDLMKPENPKVVEGLKKDDRVIYALTGPGGHALVISAHKNYTDYSEFTSKHPVPIFTFITVTSQKPIKPLSLSQLIKNRQN